MALMTQQAISSVLTPSLTQPTTSDTITADSGLFLWVENGATSTTVTVVVPGNQDYSGAAKDDLTATFSNATRVFYIPSSIADPSTNLVTVTYSDVTTVTSGLFKI